MIAFVFPGQGSQQVGMGKALAERFDVCRETLEQADAALGESLTSLCFKGPEQTLRLTENTQPAVLAVSVAVYRLLVSRGVTPAIVAGHSLGEYSAHVAAGTISFADALRTVRRRGRFMQAAVPVGTGAMAVVMGLDVETVDRACAEVAGKRAKELGARRVRALPVSAPFHCAMMEAAERQLAPVLRSLVVSDPEIPVVVNIDGQPTQDAAAAIDALVRQVSAPVQWEAVVQQLTASGVTTFVEVGPGRVLSGLIKKIDRQSRVASVEDPDGLDRLERLLAEAPAGREADA
jgi:[acyl-carrier-protein] S-malonyltransferase